MTDALALPSRMVLGDLLPGAVARDPALVVVGAGVTGAAAQVSIHTPLSPVPFTLQTLAVLVVGASLGSVRGVLALLTYMLAGLAGTPWFAGGTSGYSEPSFGYVIGFVVAAGLAGFLARRGADRRVATTILLMILGNLVIYAVGTAWLAADLHLSAWDAFNAGIKPFLATDAVKIACAAVLLPGAWRLVRGAE